MKKGTKRKKAVHKKIYEGLEQTFQDKDGKSVSLKDVLDRKDWWELKDKDSVYIIITHKAIQKLADIAGINRDPEYNLILAPDIRNDYAYIFQCKICDSSKKCTIELGEANRKNLGPRGRNNPGNMAQKRAYDRAVLRHLGLTGFLGEDELPDKEDKTRELERLSPDETKPIAGLINEIISAKNVTDLKSFTAKMKKEKHKYTDRQLEGLRRYWLNKKNSFEKTF